MHSAKKNTKEYCTQQNIQIKINIKPQIKKSAEENIINREKSKTFKLG